MAKGRGPRGRDPALGKHQARKLLVTPATDTLKYGNVAMFFRRHAMPESHLLYITEGKITIDGGPPCRNPWLRTQADCYR